MGSEFNVLVILTAKADRVDELRSILQGLTGPSNEEAGMVLFAPCQACDDPTRFFVYESYRDRAAWDRHNEAPHFLAAVDRLIDCVTSRERIPCLPISGLHA
jgi:(4S)-4-hydroxy-5-phosphonooxypentane-2,3-dione isomerase